MENLTKVLNYLSLLITALTASYVMVTFGRFLSFSIMVVIMALLLSYTLLLVEMNFKILRKFS